MNRSVYEPQSPIENLTWRLKNVAKILDVWLSVRKIKSFTDKELVVFAKDVTYGFQPDREILLISLRYHHAGKRMTGPEMESLAKRLSRGDEVVAELLVWSMHYNGNRAPSEPSEHEGVYFWSVGHNASHQFYAGTKDGKRYHYSSGEGLEEGSCEVSPVQEVQDWGGYYGHF